MYCLDAVRQRRLYCEDLGFRTSPELTATPQLFARALSFLALVLWRDCMMLTNQLAGNNKRTLRPEMPPVLNEPARHALLHMLVQRFAIDEKDTTFFDRYYLLAPVVSEDRHSGQAAKDLVPPACAPRCVRCHQQVLQSSHSEPAGAGPRPRRHASTECRVRA